MVAKTIDDIVYEMADYILENGGPDRERRAHPERDSPEYEVVTKALDIVHETGQLEHIKPWHFRNIRGIWTGERGKENARVAVGELISHLMEKYGWEVIDIIRNYSSRAFQNEPIEVPTQGGSIIYCCSSVVQTVYGGFLSEAVIDWIQHNEDPEIREGYGNIRPWHFRGSNVWAGEKGRRNAREATGEFIAFLMREHNWTLTEVIEDINDPIFREGYSVNTKDGELEYSAYSMLTVYYNGSPSAAVLDWIQNNEDPRIREGYGHIRPWHFGNAPRKTWTREQGMENAREATGELIAFLMKEHGWTLTDVIENIDKEDFKRNLCLETPDGQLRYKIKGMWTTCYSDSPYAAVLDWIQNNEDPRIREGYGHIRPWHFGNRPQKLWVGENGRVNAKAAVGELVRTRDIRTGRISQGLRLTKSTFSNEAVLLRTPDGILTYSLGPTILEQVYGGSVETALSDFFESRRGNGTLRTRLPKNYAECMSMPDESVLFIDPGQFREVDEGVVVYRAQLEMVYESVKSPARDFLVRKYTPYFRTFKGRTLNIVGGEREDLSSVIGEGILAAIETYDPVKGASFKTYMIACVHNEISKAWQHASTKSRMILNQALSLEAKDDDDRDLGSRIEDRKVIRPEVAVSQIEFREKVEELLTYLPDREAFVLEKRYYEGCTLEEVGFILGVTRARVGQIEENALKRLKNNPRAKPLLEYL